jgi:hypothetical protein
MKPILVIFSLVFVGACYSEEPGVAVGYSAGYGYGYAGPQLEYVSPGVQVIADYDYPVFYSDGYYWRNDGGIWYRSGFYNRGWAVSYNVPYGVRGISNPGYYTHYRANGNWGRGGGPAYRNEGGVNVRDHRGGAVYRGGGPSYRPAPSRPVVRDHRR